MVCVDGSREEYQQSEEVVSKSFWGNKGSKMRKEGVRIIIDKENSGQQRSNASQGVHRY